MISRYRICGNFSFSLQSLQHFMSIDVDGDSLISLEEAQRYKGKEMKSVNRGWFEYIDADGDGYVNVVEFDKELA